MDKTAFAKQQVFVLLSRWSIKFYKIKCDRIVFQIPVFGI